MVWIGEKSGSSKSGVAFLSERGGNSGDLAAIEVAAGKHGGGEVDIFWSMKADVFKSGVQAELLASGAASGETCRTGKLGLAGRKGEIIMRTIIKDLERKAKRGCKGADDAETGFVFGFGVNVGVGVKEMILR